MERKQEKPIEDPKSQIQDFFFFNSVGNGEITPSHVT